MKLWISSKEKTISNIKRNDSYSATANSYFDKKIAQETAQDMGYFLYWE